MKFESPIGLGEIVEKSVMRGEEVISSELLEVVSITFGRNASGEVEAIYHCRHPKTLQVLALSENELEGDPSFDQEAGHYPAEVLEESEPVDSEREDAIVEEHEVTAVIDSESDDSDDGAAEVLKPEHLFMSTYRPSGVGAWTLGGDTAVQLVHIPTGILVRCELHRSQHRNKNAALKRLRKLVLEKASQ